jgi:hypothetical protein
MRFNVKMPDLPLEKMTALPFYQYGYSFNHSRGVRYEIFLF